MADERKKKLTQTMGAYSGEETANPPPKGNRAKDPFGDEHRGLAAFEKGQPAAPSHGAKGSSRWSGGGSSSAPPPKKPEPASGRARDDDDDLRAARLEAKEVDDDGMVNVSGSLWGDEMAPGRGGGKRDRRARAPVEEEVEEEEEQAPKKKSSAWKWVVATLLLGGAGAGAAIGLSQTQGVTASEVDAAGATKVAAKDEPAKDEPEAATEDKASAPAEDEDAGSAPAEGEDAAAASEPADAGEAAEVVAAVEPPKAPTGPAAWAPAVEASNPWVAIAAAPAGKMLGLSPSEAHDNLGGSRTGLWPAAKLMAPEQGFQLATHEVTWKELEQATTLPEVAALARPKWVPKDAKRRANLPATGVPWQLAEAFCEGLGGKLPSEAEYEWAARGADDRLFPWGRDAVDTNDVHIVAGRPVPVIAVATSKLDKTPEPTVLYDLLGNAQEWTRDAWRPSDPSASDARGTTHKAIRGWPLVDPPRIPAEGSTYRAAACADASCMASDGALLERVGFRCVKHG